MMAFYTAILVVSALLASLLGGRVLLRIARELGGDTGYAQLAVVLSAMGFLTVVSLQTGVLVAALVLTLGAAMRLPFLLLMLPALALAGVGIYQSPGTWPASIPEIVAVAGSVLVLAIMLAAAMPRALPVRLFGAITIASVLPLAVAPWLFATAHSSLTLDAALIASAIIGGMLVATPATMALPLLRLPLALLVGYGAVQAAHYGAWPLAATSVAIWCAGMLMAPRNARVAV